MTSDRDCKFVRDCFRNTDRFIFDWYELTPDTYDLAVEDIHEITGHLLRCTVKVYSECDEISNLVFVFTESASEFKQPLFEVLQRL